ncbi:DUF664 domain-containing protein [Actinacidiphila sp. ITFR-21]|uniref:mycothiol transferase n=1 Tax=Actinacidiphila sp. ITFR-21 TaxID=3075199 RepID=UPI00288C22AE|nr:DUF664 domain-containing protein [Streptomyces sp. ITFR-21]WNI18193.1 DUF664 domain-containing protein [Streptomyces sp. ITFR-21]
MAGQDVPRHHRTEADPDAAFTGAAADPEMVAEAWRSQRFEVDVAERFVADSPGLGVLSVSDRRDPIVPRELLVHMIEEYVRHNGHADLPRERIDGGVGQ